MRDVCKLPSSGYQQCTAVETCHFWQVMVCEVVFAHLERPSAIRKVDSVNESADFTSVRK